MSLVWHVRLTNQAELDLLDITMWTAENFGPRQAEHYVETVGMAIEALHDGPTILGAQSRDDIRPGIRTLHVARHGRKGRHFIVFMESHGQNIDVLRLLHDSMELARHAHAAMDQTH